MYCPFLAGQYPVCSKLVDVLLTPLLNQSKSSRIHPALDSSRLDLYNDCIVLVFCMEVRRHMISPVHVDDDAKETTDNGHAAHSLTAVFQHDATCSTFECQASCSTDSEGGSFSVPGHVHARGATSVGRKGSEEGVRSSFVI